MTRQTITPVRVECGTYRHAWFDADSDWRPRHHIGGQQVTVRCDRCMSERREIWTRSGRLVYRRYVHSSAWRMARQESGPLTLEEMRVVMLALRRRGYTSTRGKRILQAVSS